MRLRIINLNKSYDSYKKQQWKLLILILVYQQQSNLTIRTNHIV